MLKRVCAPRSPLLGDVGDVFRGGGSSEPGECPLDAEVGGEECVGVAEGAHGYVLGGPRPDAWNRHQPRADLVAIAAGIDDDLLPRERRGESVERSAAADGPRERRWSGARDRVCGGKEMRQAAVRGRQGLAERNRELGGCCACGRDRDLLSEDSANRKLRPVDGAGHPQAGHLGDQRGEQGVVREVCAGDAGVGVEVEQSPAALNGGGEVAEVCQLQPARDVSPGEAQLDDAVAVREAQRTPVGGASDLLDTWDGAGRGKPSR